MRHLILFLAAIIPLSSTAQKDTISPKIEKIFAQYTAKEPGCQLSISYKGKLIFSKAWGMANLETGTPLTMNSVIEAGSVSKQFTAAAILLLEQQGKLSLEDDIRKYLPEIPDYGTLIKIKHLIHHTSGLKDWGTIAALTGFGRGSKSFRNEDALEIIAQQRTLNNVPGAEFIYSNSNYNLLAIIVQRVSGKSLADFTKEYIFTPAGMTRTQWRDNFRRVVPNRAVAYYKTGQGYESDMFYEDAYGNGGLLTTSEDLLKWNTFYLSGKFGQPSLLQKQITKDTLNDQRLNQYAAGLFIQTSKGKKVITHDGATGSYRCDLTYFPELDLSIAWLSNSSRFDTASRSIAGQVQDIFVPAVPAKPVAIQEVQVPLETLKNLTGWYQNTRLASGIQISIVEGHLVMEGRTRLNAISGSSFKTGSDILAFDTEKNLWWITANRDSILYKPVPPPDYTPQTLAAFKGTFYSTEATARLAVEEKSDTLYLKFNSYESFRLQPTYRDGFRIPGFGGNLKFQRSANGEITGFYISQGRARNVVFVKDGK
ncbi:MAG: serine hydrolase [Citrobacter freundii]|nr:MAG: serine hydrolase [Citrobacter freundii]